MSFVQIPLYKNDLLSLFTTLKLKTEIIKRLMQLGDSKITELRRHSQYVGTNKYVSNICILKTISGLLVWVSPRMFVDLH